MSTKPPPVLLLMDSPCKRESGPTFPTTTSNEPDKEAATLRNPTLVPAAGHPRGALPSSQDPLGRLLVEMTAQVQDERSKRSDVERRNQSLLLEIEQLRSELLDLKASREQLRRRNSTTASVRNPGEDGNGDLTGTAVGTGVRTTSRDENAEFWWRELQTTKKDKDKALVDLHQRALQVMELNACVSMQHDELKALRTSDQELRQSLAQAETQSKESRQQQALLFQETQVLREEVAHLNTELGKRGVHFKTLMEKWTESQAQREHLERENQAMLEQMRGIQQRNEQCLADAASAREERDVLQHQVHQLKGAVAAKSAEAKAFQAYGTTAREHLQDQQTLVHRHQIFRRQVFVLAREAVVTLRTIKKEMKTTIRMPLVSIQHELQQFLRQLQTPVVTLAIQSRRYAEVVHVEHEPMRMALVVAERTRQHLHEQMWRTRRNAMVVCQIRSPVEELESPGVEVRTLRANYSTGELLLKEMEETVVVKCDAIYSDRSREWNQYETIVPILQSVLDGYNACMTTFEGMSPLSTSTQPEGTTVPTLVLTQLFELVNANGGRFHRLHLTLSYLAVYQEQIYDLLRGEGVATSTDKHPMVVLEVENAQDAVLVLQGGEENLRIAHENQLLDCSLTHRVITLCCTHENLLLGTSVPTKSKLQIVELATGPTPSDSDPMGENEDDVHVKAHVVREHGILSLLTALADVRRKDATFVRYHSSKLPSLLQDTIKASAKFLALVAMPASVSSTTPSSVDPRTAQVTRWLQQFRMAVGSPYGTSMSLEPTTDRTVEGFIHRFTQQAEQWSNSSSALGVGTFSPPTGARERRLSMEVDPKRWEQALEGMYKRYGDLQLFMTQFYQPPPVSEASAIEPEHETIQGHGPVLTLSDVEEISANTTTLAPPPPPTALKTKTIKHSHRTTASHRARTEDKQKTNKNKRKVGDTRSLMITTAKATTMPRSNQRQRKSMASRTTSTIRIRPNTQDKRVQSTSSRIDPTSSASSSPHTTLLPIHETQTRLPPKKIPFR